MVALLKRENPVSNWEFCRDSLVKLSRTFALPISMLPDNLERVVTCGYLLCRIADTVEDRADLTLVQREELYRELLRVLEHDANPQGFCDAYLAVTPEVDHEAELALGLPRVLSVLAEARPEEIRACKRWVCELTRGMEIFSHRQERWHGVVALESEADLERYCYFVAGTVGRMLTDLFILNIPNLAEDKRRILRAQAEAFGAGLQLVNIIKDFSEDLQRGWSFIPSEVWSAGGLTPERILDPRYAPAGHRALRNIFGRAYTYLDRALHYALAIPAEQKEIRLFCLVPLWLAVATLNRADHNDELFDARKKVKISRQEVMELIGQCNELVGDDAGLRRHYVHLVYGQPPTPELVHASSLQAGGAA